MSTKGLKIAGGMVGFLLAGSVFLHFRRKRQDKVASALLKEVTRIVKPTTAGLLDEAAFDIHYKDEVLKKVSGKILTLKKNTAAQHAQNIHKAWGAWWTGGDDERRVYAVFRALKDKVQVSQVAKTYQDTYGKNLIDKLHDKMDKGEVKVILDIIRPLPAYRTI